MIKHRVNKHETKILHIQTDFQKITIGVGDQENSSQLIYFGRQHWWRKLRTTAATIKEATDDDIVGEGSFIFVCRSSPLMVEQATYGRSYGGGNCARKIDLRIRPSMAEEASVLRVGSGGNDRGSVNDGFSSCARVYGLRSCGGRV